MNAEKLNKWLAVLANFGVVIGLALLVFELRETQRLAETEASVRRLNQMQEAQTAFALSDTIAALQVKAQSVGVDSLSPAELRRLQFWESSVRLRMRSQYIQYVRGYLDAETAEGIVQAAVRSLPYWEELGYELGDDEIEQAIRQAADK
jgi:hypothetical protein